MCIHKDIDQEIGDGSHHDTIIYIALKNRNLHYCNIMYMDGAVYYPGYVVAT